IFTYGDVINQEIALLSSGERIGGVNLTSMAFDASLPGFSYVLAFAVVLFAFSSILSWAYYGSQAWAYLFGKSKKVDWAYKSIFLLFTVLGSAISLEAVIKFSEAMILALVFPNMIGLFFLFPEVKGELNKYLKLIRPKKEA
ncbi:MAG: alanine:cation symporter family protein, partial [Bacteroidota bacterium]